MKSQFEYINANITINYNNININSRYKATKYAYLDSLEDIKNFTIHYFNRKSNLIKQFI